MKLDELYDDPGAEARYQALATADADGFIAALYDASWRVRRHAAELVARAASAPVAKKLIAVLADRDQTGARNAAATALALAGSAVRAPLIELLKHPDPDQRKLAADILGERKDAEAVDGLVRALADPDPNVQGAAAEALGRIGGHRAARALNGLVDSPHALVRACALDALFALKKPPPLARLVPLLPLKQAWRLLGLHTHPAALGLIARALESPDSREGALGSLGIEERTWPNDAEGALRASLKGSPDAIDWLARMLRHEDRVVRVGAMHAAAALKAHALAPAIAEAVGDGEAADAAARALTRLGLYGALALIEGDLPPIISMGPEARALAAEAITRVGEPALVPHLERLLACGDAELSEVAVRALGRCRTPAAIAPLLVALDDDALASAAARALARIGASFKAEVVFALTALPLKPHVLRAWVQVDPAGARDALKRAANDSDEAVRAAAAEGVTALPRDEAEEAIGRALSDEAAVVRRAAARTLVQLGAKAAPALLGRALRDREPSVVAAACDAAGELKTRAVAPRLEELLVAPQGFLVLAALQALVSMGALDDAKAAVALQHADSEVVKAALTLLADRPMCAAHATRLLLHARWDVRAAAARALEVTGSAVALAAVREAAAREPDVMARSILEGVASRLSELQGH